MRWSLVVIGLLITLVVTVVVLLNRESVDVVVKETEVELPELRDTPVEQIPEVRFVDVTQESGVTFVHVNGAYGDKLLPETMGAGCALFDFDQDGDIDILFVNSQFWPWDESRDEHRQPKMAL